MYASLVAIPVRVPPQCSISWPSGMDVKALLGGVPGFVSYAAFRSGDGGVTVTVCEDEAGTEESSRRAAEFVKENISTPGNPPVISAGTTVLQFSS